MKGQMFIITMVFLIGLIFAVQYSLSLYSNVDLADAFQNNKLHILKSVESSFVQALDSSKTCSRAEANLEELESFFEGRIISGTSIQVDYSLECSKWGFSPLNLSISLKSLESDTYLSITA